MQVIVGGGSQGYTETMIIFTNIEAAQQEGFQWFDELAEVDMHLVVRVDFDASGRRVSSLALARKERRDE